MLLSVQSVNINKYYDVFYVISIHFAIANSQKRPTAQVTADVFL